VLGEDPRQRDLRRGGLVAGGDGGDRVDQDLVGGPGVLGEPGQVAAQICVGE
jgi:hypothetical protein